MDELKLKKVAAYCRVSTEKQADEQTIDVQKRFLQEWADANNAIITQWYLDDGWSGDTLDRPEVRWGVGFGMRLSLLIGIDWPEPFLIRNM